MSARGKLIAVIQARAGGTRLPGKVFEDICGRSMLQHVIDRTKLIPDLDGITLATAERDERFRQIAYNYSMDWFAGDNVDPDNVLSRIYWTARIAKADAVLRITADCPALDCRLAGDVVHTFRSGVSDFVSNASPSTDGTDVECFTFELLRDAWKRAKADEREHVTTWMRNRIAGAATFLYVDGPPVHLSVDTAEDLEHMRHLYKTLPWGFHWKEAVDATLVRA